MHCDEARICQKKIWFLKFETEDKDFDTNFFISRKNLNNSIKEPVSRLCVRTDLPKFSTTKKSNMQKSMKSST